MFTGSKSSTMNKRLLPLRLYHFCVELAKKFDYKCIYDTVKKTNMYDNHTFILHGKKVIPTSIYNGIWFNPDSTCDHEDEDGIWFSVDAYVFVIVEVNNRFYIPKSSYDNDDWKEINNEELEDFAIDIINEKHLVRGFRIENFDFFIEQKLDDDIIYLDELYHKVKINNNLYRALKAFSEKNNYVCIYSSIKKSYLCDRECLLNDKLVKTKIYGGFFIDKNSRKIDNSNVSYDGNYYRIGEVDNKFYYCIEDRSLKEKDCSSSIQKYIHIANKNNLLHEKITIGEWTSPIWTDKILLESI